MLPDKTQRACETCGTPFPEGDDVRRRFCSARCRKAQYAGTCVDCGAKTNGSNGRAAAGKRCAPCSMAYQHEARYWTPERLIEGVRAWAADLGRTPHSQDANQGGARVPYPPAAREFGSWPAFIRAAGLPPTVRYDGDDPAVVAATAHLYQEGFSARQLAELLGVSPGCVLGRLKAAGVQRRSAHRRKRSDVPQHVFDLLEEAKAA